MPIHNLFARPSSLLDIFEEASEALASVDILQIDVFGGRESAGRFTSGSRDVSISRTNEPFYDVDLRGRQRHLLEVGDVT